MAMKQLSCVFGTLCSECSEAPTPIRNMNTHGSEFRPETGTYADNSGPDIHPEEKWSPSKPCWLISHRLHEHMNVASACFELGRTSQVHFSLFLAAKMYRSGCCFAFSTRQKTETGMLFVNRAFGGTDTENMGNADDAFETKEGIRCGCDEKKNAPERVYIPSTAAQLWPFGGS